uniref:Uncharacterized protein n=1 Tax=Arundo donax TaxID=35708 RepID=A0A0A8ZV19_ARUDO
MDHMCNMLIMIIWLSNGFCG